MKLRLMAALLIVVLTASQPAAAHWLWPATGVGFAVKLCPDLNESVLAEVDDLDPDVVLFSPEDTGSLAVSVADTQSYLMWNIAVCKIIAVDRERDIERARELLTEASARGNESARHTLASMNIFTTNDEALHTAGYLVLKNEAANRSAWAIGKLGYAKFLGRGTNRSEAEALVFYEQAATAGMTPWIFVMAHIHERGLFGLDPSVEESQRWLAFEPKIHTGSYECTIASLYAAGLAFPKNTELREEFARRCDAHSDKTESH